MNNLRKEKIKELYLNILGREADESGLFGYCNSSLSIEEISNVLHNSSEKKINHFYDPNWNNKNIQHDEVINLYKDDCNQVDYFKHNIPTNKILITFRGRMPDLSLTGFGFWGKNAYGKNYDVISFKSQNSLFYTELPSNLYDTIANILPSYNTRYGIGISMGAYPIVKYSKKLKLNKIMLLSVRRRFTPEEIEKFKIDSTIHTIDIEDIDNQAKYVMFHNPSNLEDLKDLNYFLNFLPKNKTKLYHVDDAPHSHGIVETLYNMGIYKEFVNCFFDNHEILNHPDVVLQKIY